MARPIIAQDSPSLSTSVKMSPCAAPGSRLPAAPTSQNEGDDNGQSGPVDGTGDRDPVTREGVRDQVGPRVLASKSNHASDQMASPSRGDSQGVSLRRRTLPQATTPPQATAESILWHEGSPLFCFATPGSGGCEPYGEARKHISNQPNAQVPRLGHIFSARHRRSLPLARQRLIPRRALRPGDAPRREAGGRSTRRGRPARCARACGGARRRTPPG
jgi:hypothetical protein